MAGHARYTAVLDACVLYSVAMTDALLSLATAGLYAAKWTTRIEDEWIRALENSRPDLIGRLDVRREWDLYPVAVISAFKRMRARRRKPESTPDEFAAALERAGLPATAGRLREAAELI